VRIWLPRFAAWRSGLLFLTIRYDALSELRSELSHEAHLSFCIRGIGTKYGIIVRGGRTRMQQTPLSL
jgi:hypothetical protein